MSRVLALVPDLMDRSKVVNAAPDTQFVSSASALRGALSFGPEVVVVDLSRPGAVDAARAAVGVGARVVAFGSHVQRDLLVAARDAGCDEVVARSAFFSDIAARLDARRGDAPAGRANVSPSQSSPVSPAAPVQQSARPAADPPAAPRDPSGAVAMAAVAATEVSVAGLVGAPGFTGDTSSGSSPADRPPQAATGPPAQATEPGQAAEPVQAPTHPADSTGAAIPLGPVTTPTKRSRKKAAPRPPVDGTT